jgi:hypothetical protein
MHKNLTAVLYNNIIIYNIFNIAAIHWCSSEILALCILPFTIDKAVCVLYIVAALRWLRIIAETCGSGSAFMEKCHLLVIKHIYAGDALLVIKHIYARDAC